jgi:Mrp family chromosome partitioning ATPase
MFAMRTRPVHTLLVTSAIAGEGKTTTSANLAATFARMGKRVVIVDADMRRPRLHRVFKLSRAPGVSEILQGEQFKDARAKPSTGLRWCRPGRPPSDRSAGLGGVGRADGRSEAQYDLILIDSPVLLAVPDSLLLAAQTDGVVLVHKPGVSSLGG